ncbi:hypothetical protein LTR84_011648 [Exophiala bonariae]|uniref:Major facilitator superfamily (MFS) profile domain-containing protein n=1 Tax=Exophiala bonariae TaxID=1690606 RepID=A0AAV9NHM9_9EURO|nr:hypothetical protein LTR84_011648 [Exophiala bonariae]
MSISPKTRVRDDRSSEMISSPSLPGSRGSSNAPASNTSNGIIRVDNSVTVEVVPRQGTSSTSSPVFGDASQFYQATVSATSQFARNLFSTTTLHDSNPDVSATPPRNKRWIVISMLLASINLVCTVADTMLAPMLPVMIVDLDVEGFQWALAGPSIGAAATVLMAGQFYALYPFASVYAVFSVLTLIGMISSGFAPNMIFVFYARILLGAGTAGQQLGAMIFLDHDGTFTDKARRDFFISVSTGLGLVLGPFFGAAFAHRENFWKWGFYSIFILTSILFIGLVYALPSRLRLPTAEANRPLQNTWRSFAAQIDLIGAFLSVAGILALFITLNLAGTWTPWSGKHIYIPLAVSGLLIFVFTIQQSFSLGTHSSLRVFPMYYVRHFKTTILFGLIFLFSGILNTTLLWGILYQMLTRAESSAVGTALYFFLYLTGPHFVPMLLVPVYIGSGLVTSYPILPSYTIWSVVTSSFLLVGTVLLFVDGNSYFSSQTGLPLLGRQFSLACIG